MPIFKQVNKDFFKKWTPEMAYVLGFFAADGYITVNKRGGQFWSIQIIDRELLEKIKEVVKSDHKIGVKKRKENESTLYRLQIGSIEMCDDLRGLGFNERKTKSMPIPNIPMKYLADFVRGYFDGDGNVWTGENYHNKINHSTVIRTSFTSCSEKFLLGLQQKLKNIGLGCGSCYKGTTEYFRLSYSINDSIKLYRLMYFCYPGMKLYLPRKRRVFEKFIKMRS